MNRNEDVAITLKRHQVPLIAQALQALVQETSRAAQECFSSIHAQMDPPAPEAPVEPPEAVPETPPEAPVEPPEDA